MTDLGIRDTPVLGGAIQRRTLHDEVVDRMRDMIIEGHLHAGERINETELCRQLGVSRTPVREAVKTLASEGLIAAVRNKGAIVNRLGADEILQMLEAAAMIETHAARVGVERGSDHEIAAIAKLHEEMRTLYEARDRLPYYKLNQAIHTAIVALAHNETLSAMHEGLQKRLRRIRYVGNEKPTSWSGAMREHELMISALTARNGESLAKAIGEHFDKTNERIVQYLQAAEPADDI
ncbi:MAG: GntR family transcriptional regulator [Pseudomonadota bacterium]